jgi:hypothetical protein
MTMTEHDTDSGVRVVGATGDDTPERDEPEEAGRPPRRTWPGSGGEPGAAPSRRAFRIVSVLAAAGLLLALIFGILYATSGGGDDHVQDPAVLAASRTFLTNFFNFDAKTVDANFNTVEGMATGAFSNQAQQFFNSNIRKALQQALAESRGQIRYLEVQKDDPAAGTASIYAVIDQTYVNTKISTPQSDVVRLIADLKQVNGTWKISNVTVLEGATPASAGSASGSAGSSVPGQ